MGTPRSAALSKSELGKLSENSGQLLPEMPCGTASPYVIDASNESVLISRYNLDCPFTVCRSKVSKQNMPRLGKVLIETIKSLPLEPNSTCPRASAIMDQRFE